MTVSQQQEILAPIYLLGIAVLPQTESAARSTLLRSTNLATPSLDSTLHTLDSIAGETKWAGRLLNVQTRFAPNAIQRLVLAHLGLISHSRVPMDVFATLEFATPYSTNARTNREPFVAPTGIRARPPTNARQTCAERALTLLDRVATASETPSKHVETIANAVLGFALVALAPFQTRRLRVRTGRLAALPPSAKATTVQFARLSLKLATLKAQVERPV